MTRIVGVLKPLLVVTALAGILSACHYHGGHYGYRDGGYHGPRGGYGYQGGYHGGYRHGYWR
ncbi:hypothetical protein [Stella sp.]|uniref:hypothetical protein n=1 Tax=Stella sp. TaxID=2912054 RepID=UPI0035B4B9AD